MTQKSSVAIQTNDKGEPIAGLFRINGYWIWCTIKLMDEDESVELLENRDMKI